MECSKHPFGAAASLHKELWCIGPSDLDVSLQGGMQKFGEPEKHVMQEIRAYAFAHPVPPSF